MSIKNYLKSRHLIGDKPLEFWVCKAMIKGYKHTINKDKHDPTTKCMTHELYEKLWVRNTPCYSNRVQKLEAPRLWSVGPPTQIDHGKILSPSH